MYALLLLTVVSVILFNRITLAQNLNYYGIPNNINNIASSVTVLLKERSSDGSEFFPSGSGVLIEKKNNEYSILTVSHNLDSNRDNKVDGNDKIINNYQITTYDNKNYSVTNYTLLKTKELGNLDLAVLSFSSQNDYETAKFIDSQDRLFVNSIQPGQDIYVAGFPETREGFTIDKGEFLMKLSPAIDGGLTNPFSGGYSLIYKPISSNGMASGMSGGPIFTSNGYLIGVHGRQDYWNEFKLGIGIDVFINTYSEEEFTKPSQKSPLDVARNILPKTSQPAPASNNKFSFTINKILSNHADTINSLAISADSKKIVSGSDDKTIKIWDLTTGELFRTLKDNQSTISSVVINSGGRNFFSGSINPENKIKIWNLQTGELLKSLDRYSSQCLCESNLLGSGSGSYSGGGYSYSYSCNSFLFINSCGVKLESISPDKQTLAVSPDQQTLVSNGIELIKDKSAFDNDQLRPKYTVRIWNIGSGKLVKTLEGHSGLVTAVAISSDGKIIASGSSDTTIKLWNLQTGELLHTLKGHTNQVSSLAISYNGQIIASGSSDKTIKLWNIKTGELLNTLEGHSDGVTALAIRPYGQIIASGSSDKTIKLWDLQTGELLHTLEGHSDGVTSLAISQNRKFIASGSQDKTIRIWSWN